MAVAPPVRVPMVWKHDPREPGSAKDARTLNIMYEPKSSGDGLFTLKRPSVQSIFADFGAGLGQGLTIFNGVVGAVVNDFFRQVNPPPTGTSGAFWEQAAAGPWTERAFPQAVVMNGLIYLMGGLTFGVGHLSDVWSTPNGFTWTLVNGAAPWGGRAKHSCCVLNNTIYLIGGESSQGSALRDVWASTDGVTWTQKPDAPWDERVFGVLVASGNGMFFMGGANNPGTLIEYNDIWFSTDGESWTEVVPSGTHWSGRFGFAAFWFENKLFVVNGFQGSGNINDAWSSSDGGQSWTQLTSSALLAGTGAMAYTIYDRKMWIINGKVGFTVTNNVYNSSDGITWNLVTANGPIAANQGAVAVTFRTPTSVSAGHYQTMYAMGGTGTGPGYTIWRAILDVAVPTSVPLYPPIAGQRYQFNSFVENTVLLIKNQSAMWVYDSGRITRVTDYGYPQETVPGLVVLGGFAYVMDPTGLIRCCAVDDPYHWPSLNAVGADYEDDPGVGIAKYKNYLVAFGEHTIQFFYDAGRNPGSPLLPYLNANINIGSLAASAGNSFASIGDFLVFVSDTKQGRVQVMILGESLTPVPISSPYVEDDLFHNGFTNCFAMSWRKHSFFVITTGARSWVYDLSSKDWTQWAYAGRTTFDWAGSVSKRNSVSTYEGCYLLDYSNGRVMQTGSGYADYNGNFTVIAQSPKIDGGINRTKFWGQLEIIGDRSNARPTIEYSDDDYENWSTPRHIDMSASRPVLYRNGSSRRRSIRYTQTDAYPMRIEFMELTIEPGL